MRARLPLAAASLGALVVAAACQGESYHPQQLGNCTASSSDQPCIGALVGAFGGPSPGDGGGGDAGDGGLPSQCAMASGDMLYLDGDPGEMVYTGTITILPTTAVFSTSPVQPPKPSAVLFEVAPAVDASAPPCIDLYFQSPGGQLTTGDYANAAVIPNATIMQPGMQISNCGATMMCQGGTGEFYLDQVVILPVTDAGAGDGGTDAGSGGFYVQSFSARFIQYCTGSGPALRGCIHYGQ